MDGIHLNFPIAKQIAVLPSERYVRLRRQPYVCAYNLNREQLRYILDPAERPRSRLFEVPYRQENCTDADPSTHQEFQGLERYRAGTARTAHRYFRCQQCGQKQSGALVVGTQTDGAFR